MCYERAMMGQERLQCTRLMNYSYFLFGQIYCPYLIIICYTKMLVSTAVNTTWHNQVPPVIVVWLHFFVFPSRSQKFNILVCVPTHKALKMIK